MGIVDAVKLFLRRYTDFQGRSSRSEFWWVYLAFVIVFLPLEIIMMSNSGGPLGMLAGLILVVIALGAIIPSIALTFRRLHDTDRSAWWILIGLIPFIGGIVLLVFYVLPGTKGPNRFGPDPLGGTQAEAFA